MVRRAFVSFEMEDRWARDLLEQQAVGRTAFEFVDYSIVDSFDAQWKTNASARMTLTRGTVVLVGASTSQSAAVLWEIAETKRQDHPLVGVQIDPDETYPIPAGIPRDKVCRWNLDVIVRELHRW
jgi:hypothetical protein